MYFLLAALIGSLAHLLIWLQFGGAWNPVVGIAGVGAWVLGAKLLRSSICHRFAGATLAAGVVHGLAWIHVEAFTWTFVTMSRDGQLAEAIKNAVLASLCSSFYCFPGLCMIVPLGAFGAFLLRSLPDKPRPPANEANASATLIPRR